jgi:hypothetical protein
MVWSGLLESTGGKLAERWIPVILSPSFAFWAGGVLAFFAHDETNFWRWGVAVLIPGHSPHPSFSDIVKPDLELPRVIATFVVAFFIVAVSGLAAQRFTLPILRMAEGYWPDWLLWLARQTWVRGQRSRFQRKLDSWKELGSRFDALTEKEQVAYVDLDLEMVGSPSPDRLLPTRLGNILRASEDRPSEKYGLDGVACWPRLWLLLPAGVKDDVANARNRLDSAALVMFWSLLFVVWSLWIWWAALLGLLAAIFSYRAMLAAAADYAALFEACFDTHRLALYAALHWPLPRNPQEELVSGEALTRYLWRGSKKPTPTFTVGGLSPAGDPAADGDRKAVEAVEAVEAVVTPARHSAGSEGEGLKSPL